MPHTSPPDGEDASLNDVLAHGGWLLIDPRPTARANPDTFDMPSARELTQVDRGWHIKAMFRLADLTDPSREGVPSYATDGTPNLTTSVERMWLLVLRRDGDDVVCIVNNKPFSTHSRLTVGATVRVPLSHAIAALHAEQESTDDYLDSLFADGLPVLPEEEVTAPEDPSRPPTVSEDELAACRRAGVRPHPPWVLSQCLVSNDFGDGSWPVNGGRFDPEPEHSDSGWAIWAGDINFVEAHETVGFRAVTMPELFGIRKDMAPYLALPPRWGFTAAPGHEDIYPIEIEE